MDDSWIWFALAGLLGLSAAFSASETALFSLRSSEVPRAGRAARAMRERPRELLATVLFGNLVVNVFFFAMAGRLLPGDGGVGDFTSGLIALVSVLIGGEIVPKVVALRARVPVARIAAPAMFALFSALGPVRRAMTAVLDLVSRALGNFARDERQLTAEDLAQILERSTGEELLANDEADLLSEIVELEGIRVREIMVPRVDVVFLAADGSNRDEALRRALDERIAWLPVTEGTPDAIAGRVRVRELLTQGERPLAQLIMPVKFVPEVGSVLNLFLELKHDRTAEAVVVDEWGGTAGIVTLEDIFEEIVGDLRTEDEARVPEVIPLGEGLFRVNGDLSIRDWNEEFGYRVVPVEFETLGGFVAALLGRIPRAGDSVRYGSLVMDVHEVRGRRVLSVDVGVDRGRSEVEASA